ncbi:unnamed protein product, partial [Discosporangium mesarthrocarpum]
GGHGCQPLVSCCVGGRGWRGWQAVIHALADPCGEEGGPPPGPGPELPWADAACPGPVPVRGDPGAHEAGGHHGGPKPRRPGPPLAVRCHRQPGQGHQPGGPSPPPLHRRPACALPSTPYILRLGGR